MNIGTPGSVSPKTKCDDCSHKNVCFVRKRVEQGQKHIINTIQKDLTEKDKPHNSDDVMPTFKIGVILCMNYRPTNAAIRAHNTKQELDNIQKGEQDGGAQEENPSGN